MSHKVWAGTPEMESAWPDEETRPALGYISEICGDPLCRFCRRDPLPPPARDRCSLCWLWLGCDHGHAGGLEWAGWCHDCDSLFDSSRESNPRADWALRLRKIGGRAVAVMAALTHG